MPNPFEGDIIYRMAQAKDFTAIKVLSNIPISTDEYKGLVERATVVRNMVPKELSKEIAKRPFEDWVRKCEGLEKQLTAAQQRAEIDGRTIAELDFEAGGVLDTLHYCQKQLASAEDRAKRAKAGIFKLLERYLDCVKDLHEYRHTSEFNDCQVEVCKNARVAVKDFEDAKGAI
jgi:hypothetical protein